jgi:3-dehydroquinate synthetase
VAFPSQTIALSTSSASYDITIGQGLLATLHPRLLQLAAGKPFRPFLITSPNVWKLWSRQVRASFPEAQSPTVLFHPAGEKHKRFSAVETLAEQLAEHGADRDSLLLAFGGGVIGDITGFLAAIYMRGIPCVQIPTTLLAQVDSSVGGKTGVNLAVGKNLIGSFHQPRAVLADIDLLADQGRHHPGHELILLSRTKRRENQGWRSFLPRPRRRRVGPGQSRRRPAGRARVRPAHDPQLRPHHWPRH